MSESPYRVCFYCADQNQHRDRSRGITHYTRELMSHLRESGRVQLQALVSKSSFAAPDGIAQTRLPFASDWLPGRLLADHFHPLIAPQIDAEIWHYPKGFLPLGPQIKVKKVGSVADVMLQFEADNYPAARSRAAYEYWLAMLRHSLSRLDLVLTLTEFSRQDILRFCDRHRVPAPPIVVAYLGVEVEEATAILPNEKKDCVLHLASHLPHKATGWLLQQWSRLAATAKDLPALHLIGTLDASASEQLAQMRNVTLTPPLPRKELLHAIASARALVLPSAIEGFGIPAVEAYLLGTPVAYARGTALEEVLGPAAPGGFERNADSLQSGLATALAMSAREISARGSALSQRFTWENCVRLTLEGYARALQS